MQEFLAKQPEEIRVKFDVPKCIYFQNDESDSIETKIRTYSE